MMRKTLGIVLVLILTLSLTACGGGYEIAMISTAEGVEDDSYNQLVWESLSTYAEDHGITHRVYQPQENETTFFIDSIDLAVARGAKVVLAPSFMFEDAFYEAQDTYPEVKFILIDGRLTDATYEKTLNNNVMAIRFATHEAGFLAGYATVKEGKTSFGFLGGTAIESVQSYGIGYIAGAFYAAKEMDVSITFSSDNYEYRNFFTEYVFVRHWASAMYTGGVEVILSAAGEADLNVMIAAQTNDAWMVATDTDRSHLNEHVLVSAVKALEDAVELGLDFYYNDTFEGGKTLTLGVDENGVQLTMETARFETFTQADYDTIYNALASGAIAVPDSYASLVTFFSDNDLDELPFTKSSLE